MLEGMKKLSKRGIKHTGCLGKMDDDRGETREGLRKCRGNDEKRR